jgi:hypothetical protein
MKYVESPDTYRPRAGDASLFLAGGITGCPDWQREVVRLFDKIDLVVLNPRRTHFPMADPTAAEAQIRWEHEYLRVADEILFWFPCESLCPIALYELGAWSMTDKPLYVGVHPDYRRRRDIEIQTRLARPDIVIVYCLDDLAKQITVAHGV